MKRAILIVCGVVLIGLGGLTLTLERIPYDREEAEVDLGSLEMSAAVEEEVRVPPLVAGAVLALGACLTVYGITRSA